MFNLDQKYESYVRNGDKKLRIDGEEHNLRDMVLRIMERKLMVII